MNALNDACRSGVAAHDFLLVEGAGGFYSPIADDGLNADLAVALGLPVLLVVADRLGCINHALLSIEAIHHRGLRLAGIFLNQTDPESVTDMDNAIDLYRRTGLPIPRLPFRKEMNAWPELAPFVAELFADKYCAKAYSAAHSD